MPFVGASGHFVDDAMASIGVRRADFRIENVVMTRPPHGSPEAWWTEMLARFLGELEASVGAANVEGIAPRAVVLVGARAMERWVGGGGPGVLALRGSAWRQSDLWELMPPGLRFTAGDPVIVPTIHPAWIFRDQRRYTPVFVRDLWRAVHDPAPRPLPLPPAYGPEELEQLLSTGRPIERLVLDIEATRERPLDPVLFGLEADGRVFQVPWDEGRARPLLAAAFAAARLVVGHNLADYDLDVLDGVRVVHHPPYHDTIAMAGLVDANLPRGLAAACSRHVAGYLQWKGIHEEDGMLRTIIRRALGWADEPWQEEWGLTYNRFDVWQTGRLHTALLAKVPQPLWDRAYVPNVERRRAMTARGMAFDCKRLAARIEEFKDALAAVAAEVIDLTDEIWATRGASERQVEAEAVERLEILRGSGAQCERHPDYSPDRAPKRKCLICRGAYIALRPHLKAASKAVTVARQDARKVSRDFNIDSPADWAWLIYVGCKGEWKRVKVRGGWARIRRAMRVTATGRGSVDDADLRGLRRRLQRETARTPYEPHAAAIRLIELRMEAARLSKALATNLEPLAEGRVGGIDGRANPVYHDFRTRSGRYSSGSENEEDTA